MDLPLLASELKTVSDGTNALTFQQPIDAYDELVLGSGNAKMEHLGSLLALLRIAGLWRPYTEWYLLKALLHGLIIGIWCGGWFCYRAVALLDIGEGKGYVLGTPYVIMIPVVTCYFSWFMCVLTPNTISIHDQHIHASAGLAGHGSRLLAVPNTSGRFADVLQISRHIDVTKWGKYATVFICILSGPGAVIAVVINWSLDTRPNMLRIPAYWDIGTNIFACIPLYWISAAVLSCIGDTILLSRDRLLNQAC
jgi:hypothetical protein